MSPSLHRFLAREWPHRIIEQRSPSAKVRYTKSSLSRSDSLGCQGKCWRHRYRHIQERNPTATITILNSKDRFRPWSFGRLRRRDPKASNTSRAALECSSESRRVPFDLVARSFVAFPLSGLVIAVPMGQTRDDSKEACLFFTVRPISSGPWGSGGSLCSERLMN